MSIPETRVLPRNPDPYNTKPSPPRDLSPIAGSTLPGPIGVVPKFKPRNTNWPRLGDT
jgi:hypothetical protein